ncbi:MAG TPA: EAL domain-containing protein, partial [Geminicoccaceae bacterium]|nr:EAL domain-containing protein [Geminicoccaceae bacterium]
MLTIDAPLLWHLVQGSHQVAVNLLRMLSRRLRHDNDLIRLDRDQLSERVRQLEQEREALRRSEKQVVRQARALEEVNAALRESERMAQRISGISPAVVHVYDIREARAVYINSEVQPALGYTREEFLSFGDRIAASVIHPKDHARFGAHLERLQRLADGITADFEYRLRHADGGWRWFYGRYAVFARDAAGRATQVIGSALDVTERKRSERRIRRLAERDELTGLPNRHLLWDRMRQALALAARQELRVGLLLLDLDHFKDVNDSLGHPVGDRLLCQAAERLAGLLRRSDMLSRLGGDEFAVVMPDLRAPDEAAALARRLIAALGRPFVVDGHKVHVAASVGIALFPANGKDPGELLRNADLALYRAKQEGRAGFRFFEPAMDQEIRARRQLEADLRRALDQRELALHYQPQVDLATGAVVAVEALVRWRHPERGLVPPCEFIPVAETSGLIRPLGAWVLGDACRQAKLWQACGQARVVAVNLSPVQLRHPDMLAAIDHVLRRHELEPRWLELEITESLLVEAFDGVVDRNLRGLAARGVQLAIDDFGVGYSSLAYLKRLPAAKIKVDRSFIRDIGADPEDEALVRAIVSLGHSLGKRVVAEGIETEPQMEFLRGVSCDIGQGLLLARPQDAAALDAA